MTPGNKYGLRCPVCSTRYPAGASAFTCAPCGAPTVVEMHVDAQTPLGSPGGTGMWRYFALLPLEGREHVVSQGEGGTPLVESDRLAARLGVGAVLLKNETVNPTGAFKDRQIALGISKAREAGADTVAVVSSGNVAASAASYAARSGMGCLVFTPANAPDARLIQARIHGAQFHKVRTLSSSRIFGLLAGACAKKGWHLLSTAGLYNPFQVEGAKTIAYELFETTDVLPDWVIAPVGGGGLLGALWRGFEELRRMGRIDRAPALVGVQSSACAPLVAAIEQDLSPAHVLAHPVHVGETIAGAIADDILFDAHTALPAVRETGGDALAVTDEEMLEAEGLVARLAGIFAEPASAATVAGLARLVRSGRIGRDDRVCCILTGSGFKDMAAASGLVAPPVPLEATEEAFLALEPAREVPA